MAIANSSAASGNLRGKIGGLVFCLQPNGKTVVRGQGHDPKPSTPAEKKGQHRMKLAHSYVSYVLGDPALRQPYLLEALKRQKRLCDVVMSDYLTDPVIEAVDAEAYTGLAGGVIYTITRDDFKAVKVSLVIRDGAGHRVEDGMAEALGGGRSRIWRYKARLDQPAGEQLQIAVTATDRCGHSAFVTATSPGHS